MKLNKLRDRLANLIASPTAKEVLKENLMVNELIRAKSFDGIDKDTGINYIDGVSIPDLIRSLWPEFQWDVFPSTGAMVAITHLQIITKFDKLFIGRLVVYLYPDEGLVFELLSRDSDYYHSMQELVQKVDPSILAKLKSFTVH